MASYLRLIESARQAVDNQDYQQALMFYQRFFNATQDKEQYFGARLSYCIGEWADLGDDYPLARAALEQQKALSLARFNASMTVRDFQEYVSIAEYLDQTEEIYSSFQTVEQLQPELAKQLFTFVYEFCATSRMWDVCYLYLGNGQRDYLQALAMYDDVLSTRKSMPSPLKKELSLMALETLEQECRWLFDMLTSCGKADELDWLTTRIHADFASRGLATPIVI